MVNLNITEAGSKWWYKGRLHRINGPALEGVAGHRAWYRHGILHRIDGPAIIIPNGTNQYWVDGKQLSEYEQMFLTKATYG